MSKPFLEMGIRGRGFAAALVLLAAAVPLVAGADAAPSAADLLGPGAVPTGDGHFRLTLPGGTSLTTHGPDYVENHGSSFGSGDPERAPVCAQDWYQHVLYGRPSGSADRLATVKPVIQAAIRRMNAVLHEESMLSGDRPADYKVKCDGAGEIQVDSFTSSGNSASAIFDAAWLAGFRSSFADYTIFYDGNLSGVCGVGSFYSDDRLFESNPNNEGGGYAVVYNSCWNNETAMHENGHNQGAVQASAPYSTGSGGHCYDENDVMCYSPDGGNKNQGGTINRCTDRIHFDCGNDTYFDSDPEAGEYLASHWNIGSPLNRFIVFGPIHRAPRTAFTMSCSALSCSFTDATIDDGTVTTWEWDFGDDGASSTQNPAHAYDAPGTYLVTLTTTDNLGLSSSSTQTLNVPNDGDPDPDAPTLTNRVAKNDRSAPNGDWKYYKIFVPQGAALLTLSVDGQPCPGGLACAPDVDLYARHGQRPTTSAFACRSISFTNDEACSTSSPAAGYWYIGVRTVFAPPSILPLSSVSYRVQGAY